MDISCECFGTEAHCQTVEYVLRYAIRCPEWSAKHPLLRHCNSPPATIYALIFARKGAFAMISEELQQWCTLCSCTKGYNDRVARNACFSWLF